MGISFFLKISSGLNLSAEFINYSISLQCKILVLSQTSNRCEVPFFSESPGQKNKEMLQISNVPKIRLGTIRNFTVIPPRISEQVTHTYSTPKISLL